jgi:hypothetical protein
MKPSPDQISVLDTKVDPFTWSTPNIYPAPSSTPFGGHTATLVGNYMIIAFGMNVILMKSCFYLSLFNLSSNYYII